eukprot:914577-Amphidinium_carterae.1
MFSFVSLAFPQRSLLSSRKSEQLGDPVQAWLHLNPQLVHTDSVIRSSDSLERSVVTMPP